VAYRRKNLLHALLEFIMGWQGVIFLQGYVLYPAKSHDRPG
jgi:hypothetical protein